MDDLMMRPRLLELAACEGGATAGYQRAGWHVTAVDLDGAALRRNPADMTVQGDALAYLAEFGHLYDAVHASFPCQRWMTGKGRRECIPPVYAEWVGLALRQHLLAVNIGRAA